MNAFQNNGCEEPSFPQLDLSGKLIIKAQLGDDIRRIPIHNEAITYDELVLMMQRVFRGKLSGTDDITIKYKDEDGDLITIFDSSDLAFAIQYSRILKLSLIVPGKQQAFSHAPAQILALRKELQSVRDRVNVVLDSLSVAPLTEASEGTAPSSSQLPTNDPTPAVVDPASSKPPMNPREFDPLQDQTSNAKVAEHTSAVIEAVVNNDGRVGTPDSIASSSGGASHLPIQAPPAPLPPGYQQPDVTQPQQQVGGVYPPTSQPQQGQGQPPNNPGMYPSPSYPTTHQQGSQMQWRFSGPHPGAGGQQSPQQPQQQQQHPGVPQHPGQGQPPTQPRFNPNMGVPQAPQPGYPSGQKPAYPYHPTQQTFPGPNTVQNPGRPYPTGQEYPPQPYSPVRYPAMPQGQTQAQGPPQPQQDPNQAGGNNPYSKAGIQAQYPGVPRYT